MSAASPVIAWAGRATSRRGRTSCYRVVVDKALIGVDLPSYAEIVGMRVDPRRLFTVERCGRDAMGESSWTNCSHSPPKAVILQMALALAEAKGGEA